MKKNKSQRFVRFLMIVVSAVALLPHLYAQNFLSRERENEIKLLGKYYWGEASDFIDEFAKENASIELSNQIIKDAVGQSEKYEEILKAIKINAHLGQLPQKGKIKILAWIAKDSVMLTIAVQRPITQNPNSHSNLDTSIISTTQPEPIPQSKNSAIITNNLVLLELAACRTLDDVKLITVKRGLVRGRIGESAKGFQHPEECIIAVFTEDSTLIALLDKGGNTRIDLLSGSIIQNPEKYFNNDMYYLWYLQQK